MQMRFGRGTGRARGGGLISRKLSAGDGRRSWNLILEQRGVMGERGSDDVSLRWPRSFASGEYTGVYE